MATICIAGVSSPALKAVESLLAQAGMAAPRAAKRGTDAVDMTAWHRHVITAEKSRKEYFAITQPGRLWEGIAADIFLENLTAPVWGWSAADSVWLLDFWSNFDATVFFLLVCMTPQQLLAETLADAASPANVEQALTDWQSYHQEMLRFHHRHAGRSLLVYAEDSLADPETLISECRSRWNLPLTADIHPAIPALAAPDALVRFLSQGFLARDPAYESLHQEIVSTAIRLAPAALEEPAQDPGLDEILADYLALHQRLAGGERQSRQEAARLQSELSVVNEALTAQKSKDEARQAALENENAQVLLQSQRIQEELEAVLLQVQEAKAQIELLKKEKFAIGEERTSLAARYEELQQELFATRQEQDEQDRILAERQVQVDELSKDLEQQKKLAGDLQQQADNLLRECEGQARDSKEQQQGNELLLLQLHQVQEELEAVFLQEVDLKQRVKVLEGEKGAFGVERAALVAKSDGLQQEVSALKLARDELGKLAADRDAAIVKLTKERDESTKQRSELKAQLEQLAKTRDEQNKLAVDRDAAIVKLTKERDESAKQLSEHKAQIDQLSRDREQQKKLAAELQKQREVLVREHEEQLCQLQAELKDELLLLQLHQVQEELEAAFLQEQEAKQQLQTVQGEKQAALTAKDDELRQENELLLLQLQQVQEELEQLQTVQGEKQAALTAKDDELRQENELLLLQLHQVQEELEQLQTVQGETQAALTAKDDELQQVNELLLLQLQQVQEELERYFLQHQQIQQQYNTTQVALQRWLQREPEFYDYDELEVTAGKGDDAASSVNCQFTNLIAAGRYFPSLAFSLVVEQGMAGLIFPAATVANFLRPLLPTTGESELVISPAGSAEKLPQHLNQLAMLSTSDWSLVTTLIRLVSESLTTPTRLQWNSPLDSRSILSGLQELARQLEPSAAQLRYDEIRLKREQVNPDYEHLWLEFANLSFAGESWPHFEFRLSCAHVRPDYFGGFPKLEFPAEGSQAPFEGWFVEANDDFGDKLELRFSLPDKGMDLGVWERVTEHDRAFMRALAAEIPEFLSALRQSGVLIARSWDDWKTMAAEMLSVLKQIDAPSAENLESNVSGAVGLLYDKARLKREQVNPDYEHLWFEFANLSFAGERWPHFEFRLSCAHVRPDYFGGFPKLEFPVEGSQAPFEGWFIEASDDFGDKLELRFSLPDKALDLGVWERVTAHDRAFLQALVTELPNLLSTLRQSGVKIRRPWEDWTKMAEEMLPIVSNPPQLKGKKKSSFKKLLRRLKI